MVGHIKPKGVVYAEQEFRRSYSFLASMIGFVGFGCVVVALNSMRWSVFDTSIHNHTAVSGKFGFYHYEATLGNSTHGVTMHGRINNDSPTALCNVLTYNAERDWNDQVERNDCDLYVDAADDGSTLGIAAAIIGGAGSIWAAASAISATEESAILHKCSVCPRLLTAAAAFTLSAMGLAIAASLSYARQRPSTPNFFLDQFFEMNVTSSSTGNSSATGNSTSGGSTSSSSDADSFFTVPSEDWELGMAVYLMIAAGCMYAVAGVLLVYVRRYDQGSKVANRYLSVPLINDTGEPGPQMVQISEENQVLEVWESEISVSREGRIPERPDETGYQVYEPNEDSAFDSQDSLKTTLLSK